MVSGSTDTVVAKELARGAKTCGGNDHRGRALSQLSSSHRAPLRGVHLPGRDSPESCLCTLAGGGLGSDPTSAREKMPGVQTSATTMRTAIAANSPGHHAPTFVIADLPAIRLVLTMSAVPPQRLHAAKAPQASTIPTKPPRQLQDKRFQAQ